MAGVDEIYRVGGAQAVAALAFGTASIPAVAKIVGPGNAYVAAAKRQVFGIVGIDMVAGPSEVLIVADADNDPDWIAADLLAQAEHDAAAQAILVTDLGGPRRPCRRRRGAPASHPAARVRCGGKLARPRRDRHGRFARRGDGPRQPHRARAHRAGGGGARGTAGAPAERRRRVPRPATRRR